MSEEIKEILSLLNSSSWSNESKILLDYITNLQQEIDRLKIAYELMERKYLKQDDYKLKNEKAIEYITKNKKSISKEVAEGTKLSVGTFMWNIDDLLNILQ